MHKDQGNAVAPQMSWLLGCSPLWDAQPSFQEPRPSGYADNEGVTCGTASGIPSAFQSCGRTCLWYSDVITASWRKRKGGDRKEYKTQEALASLRCLRRRLLECLWTRKQAQLNSRLKKSQFSFRRGCTYTDQILTLKDIIKQWWEHGRCLNVLSGPSENITPIAGILVTQSC